MEWQIRRRYKTCVDPADCILKVLLDDRNQSRFEADLKRIIRTKNFDLGCFRMFFWAFVFPRELLEDEWMLRFTFVAQQIRRTTEDLREQFRSAVARGGISCWETFDHLQTTFRIFKPKIREICFRLLAGDRAFKNKYSSFRFVMSSHDYGDETRDLMQLIKRNLYVLIPNVHPITQKQFVVLLRKLKLFRRFVSIITDWRHSSTKTDELIFHIQTWASHVSCLTCMYWIDGIGESPAYTGPLSEMMQKIISYNPGNIGLFLNVFKAAKYHRLQGTKLPSLIADYIDFLLENYVNDDVELLREGLTFLLSFVTDSPNEDSKETQSILADIYSIVDELPSTVCIPESCLLSSFLYKIVKIKFNVRELYDITPLSSHFHSHKTDAIGFLDSLLETLQNMLKGGVNFIPSVKNHVIEVYEELESLRPFLLVVLKLQNDNDALDGLWTQIVSLTTFASYVTKLCPIKSSSVWYGIVCLPNVIRDIKLVKYEFEKVKDSNNMVTGDKIESSDDTSVPRVTTSKHEGNFIGFTENVASILDNLRSGRDDLTIISISGMPGQGKTTLAQKIYDDPSIKLHFQKIAWCCVTKECEIRELFANILSGDNGDDDNVYSNLDVNTLAERLRKSLKGKRYFIVMDDIWDVKLWFQVQGYFPDDKKGSRILFTSRNSDLASQCKLYSISHHLRLFSDDESLELMKDKLFFSDGFPIQLESVARQIAVCCNGLPLAVVLVASHLQKIKPESNLWEEVAKNLKSHLVNKRCMYLMELSYKYLPHYLKPCFLYFGTFVRGQNINANTLMCLWIAEGFVKKNDRESLQHLARDHLDYLVSQNLVVVTGRSSRGKVKSCKVHDLLYDLCLQKVMGGNLLGLVDHGTILDESSHPSPRNGNYHHHWLCMRMYDQDFNHLTSNPSRNNMPTSHAHSLLFLNRDTIPIHYKSLSLFLSNFRVLTVLEMTLVHIKCRIIPEVIFYNIHLRYLSLRGSFSHVPKLIANLSNLETLKLYSAECYLRLPQCFWGIKSLNYVFIRGFLLRSDDFGENLSATVATSNIESFRGITLRYDGKTLELLRSLSRLKKLRCFFDEGFSPEWFAMFESLKLETLTIAKRIENIPNLSWSNINLSFSDTLKNLSLWYIGLPWSAMSTIGKLPHLQALRLYFNACKGTTWNLGDGEFPKLKYLKLYRLDVQYISDSDCDCDDPPFSCLETFLVYYCKKLKDTHSCFGKICTLNAIHLIACPKASNSATSIMEQQQDQGNYDLQPLVLDYDVNYDIYYDEKDDINYDKEQDEEEAKEERDHKDEDDNTDENHNDYDHKRKRTLEEKTENEDEEEEEEEEIEGDHEYEDDDNIGINHDRDHKRRIKLEEEEVEERDHEDEHDDNGNNIHDHDQKRQRTSSARL